MNRADAEQLLTIPKSGDPPSRWEQKSSHANAMVIAFGLTDGIGATIPGLTATMEWQPGKRFRHPTLLLSLFQLQYGVPERIYQLEICAADHPSHREGTTMFFGAHEHIGVATEMLPQYSGISFADALAIFCQRATLTLEGPIPAPDEFTLTP